MLEERTQALKQGEKVGMEDGVEGREKGVEGREKGVEGREKGMKGRERCGGEGGRRA